MGGCGGYFIYDGIYTPPLIKSITTPDPLTVVITLSVPDANVLQDWAQPAASIVDEKLISAHGGVQKGKINHVDGGATSRPAPARTSCSPTSRTSRPSSRRTRASSTSPRRAR